MSRYPEFAERFQSACHDHGPAKLTQKSLGTFFGVSEITARNWWLGEKMPGMANARRIADRLGVTVEWLLTGQGTQEADQAIPDLNPAIIRDVLDLLDETGTRPGVTPEGNCHLANIIARSYAELAREKRLSYADRARSIVARSTPEP